MKMKISDDSLAIIMLCSHLGLPPKPDPAPLTLKDWNPIARKLEDSGMRPADLLGKNLSELALILGESEQQAIRLSKLLERGGSLAIELERLSSLGIWVRTRADENYPANYKQRLKDSAPAVIFGAGDQNLPGDPGIAVVGSRNVDEAGRGIAEYVGNACSYSGLVVYSGGARGVDRYSMKAAIEGRGHSVGVLAHSLVKVIRESDFRRALAGGNLSLLTPYSPYAGFSVGAAMGRNKLIYTLADYGLVIASDAGKGGTWTGANEVLKHGWVPLFVVEGADVPDGNKELIKRGALPFPEPFPEDIKDLRSWLLKQSEDFKPPPNQLKLI
jgi:predicted Rossmann fold nucleotide-binding protein DprA/Smf involved in DNA uptake